ncbi:MAG: hypothetical protein R6W73_01045 [Candidatus Saliniplasma sp.]
MTVGISCSKVKSCFAGKTGQEQAGVGPEKTGCKADPALPKGMSSV